MWVNWQGATWNSVHDAPKGLIKFRHGGSQDSNMEGDLLVSYMKVLQPLESHDDGASVPAGFALVTPLLFLLVQASAGGPELWSRGRGIQLALRALTVLLVGGASGATQLLGCRKTAKMKSESGFWATCTWIPADLVLPWLGCGKGTVASDHWGILGPSAAAPCPASLCFLACLFWKQRRAVRQCKTSLRRECRR
ncbi:FLS2 [Symbiodinium natans]|uniref:FLS2 protein n=1 Tax=Symbiodinium natans TaxID=878477 RepID=A0A812TNM1_9DINO|nr:FLS2 [Symbiodinium natans]